jgi:hypothetical protein
LTEVLTSVEESSISVNLPDLPIINSKTEPCRSSSEVWLANEAGCAQLGIQSGNSESDGTWVPSTFCQRLLSTLEQSPQRLTGLKMSHLRPFDANNHHQQKTSTAGRFREIPMMLLWPIEDPLNLLFKLLPAALGYFIALWYASWSTTQLV